ncbi:uncharacterized protein FIBRA_00238 [Fibroporia radiculosa]|uniref:Uncharacterized protein n=1 Tax=Fibroporia radiculosa TaxID=599839 RepID=J7S5V2_9APHY|nr:uncharacterized protein FIBRA_00238 [Fibroporia radiculosa]CCL98244.1 predicted protein [Fibroporia radiculosa]
MVKCAKTEVLDKSAATDASRSSSNSPRKAHCCQHCRRPRLNHPRSGCPFVDPPIPAFDHRSSCDPELAGVFEGLKLESPADGKKRRGRRPVPSKPQAQDEIRTTHTPAAMSSREPTPETTTAATSASASPDDGSTTRPATPSPERPRRALRSRRLVPSLSQQEQQIFLDHVKQTAAGYVTIIKYSVDGVSDILEGARKVGLRCETIPIIGELAHGDTALVVLGRDEGVVKAIGTLGKDEKEAMGTAMEKEVERGKYPALVTAYGAGALSGALAAWTGLAFAPL